MVQVNVDGGLITRGACSALRGVDCQINLFNNFNTLVVQVNQYHSINQEESWKYRNVIDARRLGISQRH